jgi:hypothetical protein
VKRERLIVMPNKLWVSVAVAWGWRTPLPFIVWK